MMHQLDLLSERVAPTGNASADGIKKVMGAPTHDRLSVVIRESIQNSWDARTRNQDTPGIRVHISYRTLTGSQVDALRHALGQNLPRSGFGRGLGQQLTQPELAVLEIADYGTVGLAGPEHADEPAEPGEATHFVDFMRNVGKTHEQVDGGTYGFGKASFYALSQASTIYVDSVSTNAQAPVRRAMIAGLGERYMDTASDGTERNFTGRHWWGTRLAEDRIAPLRNNDAQTFSGMLGLPHRSMADSGTTIGVLAPRLDTHSDSDVATVLIRSLLANFWPKMTVSAGKQPAITFSLTIEGQPHEIPGPETLSPFMYFVEALNAVRGDTVSEPGTGDIVTGGHPKVHLGRLGFYSGPLMQRNQELLLETESDNPGDFLFRAEPVSHIAEMRSGELVVRYVQREQLPNPHWEWAGVFKTTDDEAVERAFALSEPPTHDAWNVNSLENPEHQRWLRSYTRSTNSRVRDLLSPNRAVRHTGESLGRASATLGALLPGLAAPSDRKSAKGSRSRTKYGRFSEPRFLGHLLRDDTAVAQFEITWQPGEKTASHSMLRAVPKVILEGRAVDPSELPPGMVPPRILGLKSRSSIPMRHAGSSSIEFSSSRPFALIVTVTLENNLPSTVSVTLEAPDAP